VGRPGDHLDHVVVGEAAFEGGLRESPDVDVGFDRVDALAHDQPVVDGDSESFDLALEVPFEAARRRPRLGRSSLDSTVCNALRLRGVVLLTSRKRYTSRCCEVYSCCEV